MADTNDLKPLPAIILAGGVNDDAMQSATGVKCRALVELTGGQTMLNYVVAAVAGASNVSSIVVVGDVPQSADYFQLPSSSSLLENLVKGVDALPSGTHRTLIVTSDIPFITAEAVNDFVKNALLSTADFCYPIIPMNIYRREFSGMKRTTLRLADGEFTGGNIMLISVDYIRNHQQTIFEAYAARKDVFKLSKLLGWNLLLRLVLSRLLSPKILTITQLENGVSKLLGHGAVARAIVTKYASLGTDVDKPEDVIEARKLLKKS